MYCRKLDPQRNGEAKLESNSKRAFSAPKEPLRKSTERDQLCQGRQKAKQND